MSTIESGMLIFGPFAQQNLEVWAITSSWRSHHGASRFINLSLY